MKPSWLSEIIIPAPKVRLGSLKAVCWPLFHSFSIHFTAEFLNIWSQMAGVPSSFVKKLKHVIQGWNIHRLSMV